MRLINSADLLTYGSFLDVYGYPTDEWIYFLKNYVPDDSLTLIKFVEILLPKGWYMSEWGYRLHRKYKGRRRLELHTGGWSGNEEIIQTILSNIHLTHFDMQYVMWKVGGHYYFQIKDPEI